MALSGSVRAAPLSKALPDTGLERGSACPRTRIGVACYGSPPHWIERQRKAGKEPAALLLPASGPATAFTLKVDVMAESGAALHITRADGLAPVKSTEKQVYRFVRDGNAALEVLATPAGHAVPEGLDGRVLKVD